jgi:FixJ family two-component response regulator
LSDDATVFVVDDDASVRDALTRLLTAGGFVAEAWDSAEAFLQAFRPERPGCVLLDMKMPGMSGLDLQRALAARGARLPIVFLTGHGTVSESVRAMKSGAFEFLEKPVAGEALLACVRRAVRLDAEHRRADAAQEALRARYTRLTPRERDVFPLIAAGRSNKEVARALCISHRTVELHRARIMRKLGAATLVELAEMARAGGLEIAPERPPGAQT